MPNGMKSITIHTTGNLSETADAAAHAKYQYNGGGGRQASWHYTVDAKEIWQSFPERAVCWHTGTANGNNSSLGIEICVHSRIDFPKACDNAAWLTAKLLIAYDLFPENVYQHYHWSGKDCPHELRTAKWGPNWHQFLEQVLNHYLIEKDSNTVLFKQNGGTL